MADPTSFVERVWYGRDGAAAVARAALAPLELLFRAGVAVRGALYDRGLARAHPLALPAVSVGNLTVGGTGKTPIAAWIAATLRTRGAHPALVLRGVGDDEARVHALLNPDVPVVADADRVSGTASAARAGADVVVLDDAFQHRRAARVLDLVLVSAERFDAERVRLLPGGPYREPLDALARAHAVVVTRKSASAAIAERVAAVISARHPHLRVAGTALVPDALRRWPGVDPRVATAVDGGGDDPSISERLPVAAVLGARVLAVSGIGEPRAYHAQLAAAGAVVVPASYPDHHPFSNDDIETLARRAATVDRVVCTLKDAVKIGPRWPREAPPLWYVSQRVVVERGAPVLDGLLAALLAARHPTIRAVAPR